MDGFKKITFEDMEKDDFNCEEHLVENVKDYLENLKKSFLYSLDESLVDCESPIEQMLSIALIDIGIGNIYRFNPYIDILEIENQKYIQCNEKRYRVDFYIAAAYKDKNMEFKNIKKIIVECDGKEYHHSTRDQVNNDYERTLNLQKAGYEVIKFTGSQINRNPYRCAKAVLDLIVSKMLV